METSRFSRSWGDLEIFFQLVKGNLHESLLSAPVPGVPCAGHISLFQPRGLPPGQSEAQVASCSLCLTGPEEAACTQPTPTLLCSPFFTAPEKCLMNFQPLNWRAHLMRYPYRVPEFPRSQVLFIYCPGNNHNSASYVDRNSGISISLVGDRRFHSWVSGRASQVVW